MIDKIRKNLVSKYTTMMFFMLLLVFIGNFFVINYIINQKHISSLEKYLFEEVEEALSTLKKEKIENVTQFFDDDNESVANNFVYWFDKNSKSVLQLGLSQQINETKISLMKNWPYAEKELISFDIIDEEGDKWNLVMTYQNVYNNGVFLGKVFVGKNMTPLNTIRETYFSLVSVLVIIMIILTFILADRMAEKAMVPIYETFDKQNKFVANASHEIRTPLSVILSSIDLIETKSKENLEIKDNIKSEILNIRELVNELLDLARYDSNKAQIILQEFCLTQTVKDTIKSINIMAKSKNITINFSENKYYIINADEKKIKQLVYILIDNAIKYSEHNKNIFIFLKEEKSSLSFTIKDEGIGIIKSEQEHIFNRFYRVNKARSRADGGAGLGLSIAAEIISLHKGTIGVDSDGKTGSTFSFTLKK